MSLEDVRKVILVLCTYDSIRIPLPYGVLEVQMQYRTGVLCTQDKLHLAVRIYSVALHCMQKYRADESTLQPYGLSL